MLRSFSTGVLYSIVTRESPKKGQCCNREEEADMDIQRFYDFLMEMDQLKGVYRKTFLSDGSRHENSAEHSWHLAMALMMLQQEIPETIDFNRALKMALVHDVCEIGAGDISVYDKGRDEIQSSEKEYLLDLAGRHPGAFTEDLYQLWEEYEAQETPESRWVKVLDRLLPFCLNLVTRGRSWKEQKVRKHQVLAIHEPIRQQAPHLYEWLKAKVDYAVSEGWLDE